MGFSLMNFSADEDFARELDAEDPLNHFREKFHLPAGADGRPFIYFAGNSLGLMPKSARQIVEQELDDWAKRGVDAHHGAGTPWYSSNSILCPGALRTAIEISAPGTPVTSLARSPV